MLEEERASSSFNLFTIHDSIFGRSFSDWVRDWWKWILQTPASQSIVYGYNNTDDNTQSVGNYIECPGRDPYQQGNTAKNVWFASGIFNDGSIPYSFNEAYREIVNIPRNVALLLPVINYVGIIRPQEANKRLSTLIAQVKKNIDDINPETLAVSINDVPQTPVRSNTGGYNNEPFEITVHGKDNVVRMRHVLGRKIKLLVLGDGYWLFLKPPLPVGRHKSKSFGACLQGRIQVGLRYSLDVIDQNDINNVS